MNTLLEVRAWVLKTLEQDASQVPPPLYVPCCGSEACVLSGSPDQCSLSKRTLRKDRADSFVVT